MEIVGKSFGRLTVIRKHEVKKNGTYWECECTCGNKHITCTYALNKGRVRSCGCLRRDMMTKHGMHNSRLYSIWAGMKSRCNHINTPYYKNYGGRGIEYCDRWESFDNFKTDLLDSYLEHSKIYGEENTSIDRIDNDGNYEPTNVRWATPKEQSNNQRIRKNNTSGYVGVGFSSRNNKWRARATINGVDKYIGLFDTKEEAAEARNDYIKRKDG